MSEIQANGQDELHLAGYCGATYYQDMDHSGRRHTRTARAVVYACRRPIDDDVPNEPSVSRDCDLRAVPFVARFRIRL